MNKKDKPNTCRRDQCRWFLYSMKKIIHNDPEHFGKTTKRYFLLNQNLRRACKVSFHRVRERSDHDSENVLTDLRKGVLTSWNNDWFVMIHWHHLTTNMVQKHITLVSNLLCYFDYVDLSQRATLLAQPWLKAHFPHLYSNEWWLFTKKASSLN